jgi:hypothetical protein
MQPVMFMLPWPGARQAVLLLGTCSWAALPCAEHARCAHLDDVHLHHGRGEEAVHVQVLQAGPARLGHQVPECVLRDDGRREHRWHLVLICPSVPHQARRRQDQEGCRSSPEQPAVHRPAARPSAPLPLANIRHADGQLENAARLQERRVVGARLHEHAAPAVPRDVGGAEGAVAQPQRAQRLRARARARAQPRARTFAAPTRLSTCTGQGMCVELAPAQCKQPLSCGRPALAQKVPMLTSVGTTLWMWWEGKRAACGRSAACMRVWEASPASCAPAVPWPLGPQRAPACRAQQQHRTM